MNNLTMAARALRKKKQNSIIKIVSLGTGLAVGLILFTKVFFEVSYEDFYPEVDDIHMVQSLYTSATNPEIGEGGHDGTSGAIAPGLKAEIPEVEAATRFTWIDDEATLITDDKQRLKGSVILADSCFYDVMPRPMVAGDAKEVLSRPMYAIISSELAAKMHGDPIGQTIELDGRTGKKITIGGIFEKLPENTQYKYDVVVSLSSIGSFMGDGRDNWVGNDRYRSFARLRQGTDPASLKTGIDNMVARNLPTEQLEKAGIGISFEFVPLKDIHTKSDEARRMILILSLLAVAILATAVLNYILVVVSTLVGRSREMAVYKCYGAENKNIASLIFTEAALTLFLSLIFAGALILFFRGTVEELLATPLGALFSFKSSAMLLALCGFILLIVGYFPARMFMRIPVTSAFRNFRTSGRAWKLALLFVQFIAASFLVILLVIVGRQYDTMVNDDPGYKYENLLYFNAPGLKRDQKRTIVHELEALACVELVSMGDGLPFEGLSGNNVSIPDDDRELFNIADFETVDKNYLKIFDIPVIEGTGFTAENIPDMRGRYQIENGRFVPVAKVIPTDMMVSRSFAERMRQYEGWEDGVVGKQIDISMWGRRNIVGVYEDFRIGMIGDEDKRPSIMLYEDGYFQNYIIVKLREVNPENIASVNEIIAKAMPDKDITALLYKDSMVKLYDNSRLFRNSVLLGSIVALIIVLIGLVGYVNNEISRRGAEIGVRKVNGATAADIIKLFSADILRIAIPALILGAIGAYFVAQKWMEEFSVKTPLSPLIFILCSLVVLAIILGVVVATSLKIANQNPVKSLKNE